MRFEGVPGEFSQHDFGQVDVRYRSGEVERVHFFASRLKWSRVVAVQLVADEREERLIRALLAAFETFGGVPLVTVWDRGNLVGWVKGSFFKCRRLPGPRGPAEVEESDRRKASPSESPLASSPHRRG